MGQFRVSIGVVAYNEESVIDSILADIRKQDYPLSLLEVVLIDSASTDETKAHMEQFARNHTEFAAVKLCDNPKRIQAAGWNVFFREATGDILIRIDAHASIPEDFVSKNVALHAEGEWVTGGPRPNIIDQPTPWKETLFLAESSMFGSSIAPYRRDVGRKYVNSVFHAAYRQEVVKKVGLFQEGLGRTEDNEYHYRIREAGYSICYDPEIRSYQHIRNSFGKMVSQKYANGYWIGKTVKVCRKCLSLYHFVPFGFLLGILITTILSLLGIMWVGALMWACYLALALVMTVTGILSRKKFYISDLLLPGLFLILHVAYGVGTLIGLCSKKPAMMDTRVSSESPETSS